MRLQGKVILITGASRGVGAAIAKRFALEGAHIVITARTISGLEAVDDYARTCGTSATIIPLNLLEEDKIDNLGLAILERFGKLDGLVGNAAILGALTPIGHYSPAHWHSTIDLNLNANWRLLRIMDPLLRRADHGRAIFVSSNNVSETLPYWGAYTASKVALEALVKTYAGEMASTTVRANIVRMCAVATRMRNEAMPGEDQSQLKQADQVTDIFVDLASELCQDNGVIFQAY
jgi:NAD(P)-dependent dehydrogenase (short-subunit alcohol dehydrogenase family)